MLFSVLQFGVKSKGVKYDAVLKTVKVTSPFVGELKEGDRLVAIDGRRVSEANKFVALASCRLYLSCLVRIAFPHPITYLVSTSLLVGGRLLPPS